MKKILHVVHSMNRGGLETTLMNIMRTKDKSKFQFDFLVHTKSVSDYDREILDLGGNIFRVTPRRKNLLRNYIEINNFFKIHKYDVVHMHVSSLSYITPLLYSKKYGTKTIIVHSRNSNFYTRNLLHKVFHKFNRMRIRKIATDYFSCSQEATNWLFPIKLQSQVITINNGTISSKFKYNKSNADRIRNQYNISNKLVLINVGRLHPQKNQEYLIDVFAQLNKKIEESVLFIVGKGKEKKKLELYCKDLGIGDKVIFTGVVEDVYNYLSASDVFLLPSLYEGLPGSLIEAQSNGLLCLVSESVTREAKITNLVNFLSLKEPEEWIKRIVDFKKIEDREIYSNIVSKSEFDMNVITERLLSIYDEKTSSI
jgi:glycosyltransferase involved in cell wall biosynthesis